MNTRDHVYYEENLHAASTRMSSRRGAQYKEDDVFAEHNSKGMFHREHGESYFDKAVQCDELINIQNISHDEHSTAVENDINPEYGPVSRVARINEKKKFIELSSYNFERAKWHFEQGLRIKPFNKLMPVFINECTVYLQNLQNMTKSSNLINIERLTAYLNLAAKYWDEGKPKLSLKQTELAQELVESSGMTLGCVSHNMMFYEIMRQRAPSYREEWKIKDEKKIIKTSKGDMMVSRWQNKSVKEIVQNKSIQEVINYANYYFAKKMYVLALEYFKYAIEKFEVKIKSIANESIPIGNRKDAQLSIANIVNEKKYCRQLDYNKYIENLIEDKEKRLNQILKSYHSSKKDIQYIKEQIKYFSPSSCYNHTQKDSKIFYAAPCLLSRINSDYHNECIHWRENLSIISPDNNQYNYIETDTGNVVTRNRNNEYDIAN